MNYLKLMLLGLISVTSARADQWQATCNVDTSNDAVLGESFVLNGSDDSSLLTSKELGVCAESDGALEGKSCSVAGEVEISLLESQDGEATYIYASKDDADSIYYCEGDDE